ncbi:hypothetical protein DCO56_04405 [Sphingobacterium athyrii]|uniref:Uncharacterized protein n=2 Tax=Sphingobacterium athyrii TaxID=2152717 RepID=A0A363NZF8_9SPHI|nr:hypothetical protein DCO56_04405 [Sphingobacterium athyrii]
MQGMTPMVKLLLIKLRPFLVLSNLVLTGCSTWINNVQVQTLTKNYCAPNVTYKSIPVQVIPSADSIRLSTIFSAHDFVLVKYLNLSPTIIAYLNNPDNTPLKLVAKQKITDQCMLFETELNAIAAELDCNGERIDKLAAYIDELNSNRQTRLTVASILLGAVTAVTATTIKNDKLNNGLSIAGGVGTSVLGFMTLNPKGRRVRMHMERNMLQSIWFQNNTAQIYPASVWGILSEKRFSNSENLSLLETTRQRWLKYGLDDQLNSPQEKLYFREGGVFIAEELHNLANMHNELQATIRSIQQDMRSLMQTLSTLD